MGNGLPGCRHVQSRTDAPAEFAKPAMTERARALGGGRTRVLITDSRSRRRIRRGVDRSLARTSRSCVLEARATAAAAVEWANPRHERTLPLRGEAPTAAAATGSFVLAANRLSVRP